MMRSLPFGAALTLLCCHAPAQDAEETRFFKEVAKKLDAFATYALRVGYPRQAREIWLEVLAEYDTDDEVARKALGFLRVGSSWAPDPGHQFPDRDTPDPAIVRLIQKRWRSVAEAAGSGHREQAQRLDAAGQAERARYHWDRVLRFLPNDPDASTVRNLENYEGFTGTQRDIRILKRSRMMDRAVERELERKVAVEALPDGETHPYLEAAGLRCAGVKSANFRVFGNWDQDVLTEAARNAERCLAFCTEAFAGFEGYPPKAQMTDTLVFIKTKEEWEQVLRANAAQLGSDSLEFILTYTSACRLGSGKRAVQIAGVEEPETVQDLAVRWVAQQYSGLHTDALTEGIGHAVVGRFFGRNLVFTVGQVKQDRVRGTVAGGKTPAKKKLILPDLASWEDAAVENAWRRDGTPVVELPLVTAARFPDDGRIKAWSFCDYMLRRSPTELRALDRTRGAKNTRAVAERYAKAVEGGSVDELEDSWRRFWTEDSPLINAIKNKVTPLEAFSKVAPAWLEAFNDQRSKQLATVNRGLTREETDVGWSATASADCRLHADYLKKNRGERGAAEEQTQRVELKGGSIKGRAFAQSALISTRGTDPDKVMAQWMLWPGYRDALLNLNLDTVGLYVDGSILVMDVSRGQVEGLQRRSVYYPTGNNRQLDPATNFAVPHQVKLDDLGPEVKQLMVRHGHRVGRTIGYPITVHFYGHGAMPRASTISCTVMRGKEEVKGVLHIASGGKNRRSSAPGLVAFYPVRPLKRGSEYEVTWSWQGNPPEPFRFQTQ